MEHARPGGGPGHGFHDALDLLLHISSHRISGLLQTDDSAQPPNRCGDAAHVGAICHPHGDTGGPELFDVVRET